MDESEQYLLLHKANRLEESGKIAPAVRLLRQLAKFGNVHAQANLGNLLDDRTTPRRPKEAVYWYKRAVRKGYATAAYNLAMHHRNQGKPRWQLHWLRIAAEMGDSDARKEIRPLERQLERVRHQG
jgi:TPR repeat protein